MKTRAIRMIIAGVLLCLVLSVETHGDTVYLKNGREVEGVISKETDKTVELDTGFGTITVSRNQIQRIERSTAESKEALSEKWEGKRKELRKSEKELSDARDKRFDDYDKWTKELSEKRQKETKAKQEIQLSRDPGSDSMLIQVLLDDKVKATMIVDTGAHELLLSKEIGEELGLNLSTTQDLVQVQVLGKKYLGKSIVLQSVRVQDVEEKDVPATVLTEEMESLHFKDGLFGMSFLKRFNMRIDLNTMKMTLERLKQ